MTDLHREDALEEALQLIARLRSHIELLENENKALIRTMQGIREGMQRARSRIAQEGGDVEA